MRTFLQEYFPVTSWLDASCAVVYRYIYAYVCFFVTVCVFAGAVSRFLLYACRSRLEVDFSCSEHCSCSPPFSVLAPRGHNRILKWLCCFERWRWALCYSSWRGWCLPALHPCRRPARRRAGFQSSKRARHATSRSARYVCTCRVCGIHICVYTHAYMQIRKSIE